MKKLISLTLSAALCLGLFAGCGRRVLLAGSGKEAQPQGGAEGQRNQVFHVGLR